MPPDGEDYLELRVHGVAGTPPESMLELGAVPCDPAPDPCGEPTGAPVQIFQQPECQPRVRAFSWRSLTSGSPVMALWMLLLPYMLANVAGWAMLPLAAYRPAPEDDSPRPWSMRWITFFVRLTGLLVTMLTALFAALVFVDILGYQGWARARGWAWGPALGLFLAALVVLALFRYTRVRKPGAQGYWNDAIQDPVGHAWLDRHQARMWDSSGIILRLRRLHFGAAWGFLASLALISLHELEGGWDGWDLTVFMLALGATMLSVALVGVLSLSEGRNLGWTTPFIRHATWIASLVAVAGAIWRWAIVDLAGEDAEFLPGVRGSGAWVALVLLLLVGAASLVSWAARDAERAPKAAAWNLPALLLTAATVVTIFGIGLAAQVARFFGERACPEDPEAGCRPDLGFVEDWVAVAFTWMLTVLVWIVAIRFVRALAGARGSTLPFMVALRRMTDNVSKILATLTVIGVVALVGGLVLGVSKGFGEVTLPAGVEIASVVLFLLPPLLAGLALAFGRSQWVGLVAVAALAAIVWGFAHFDWEIEVSQVSIPPSSFLAFARVVAISLPTALIASRVVAAFRNGEERRGVAIIWDLGNFWPRWFHPFAPPTYSDVAVTQLQSTFESELQNASDVILAPHSQGSIISAATLAGTDTALTERVGYLTYGSPLSRLYAQAFPAVFTAELLEALCARLTSTDGTLRWRNLYRPTDPIGGKVMTVPPGVPAGRTHVADEVDEEVLPVICGRSHSDYPKEAAYATAREELLAAVRQG